MAETSNEGSVVDRRGRPLRDLRISVTDRCNFRCGYCMPKEVYHDGYRFAPRDQVLRFEELARLAELCVRAFGVTKIRLTGGEPLLRKDLPALVAMLARIEGVHDLTLTTNGLLLAEQAQALADAGLGRVTVSLDALDVETFAAMNGGNRELQRVLDGIAAAERAGLAPIKVNCVVIRDQNEHAIEALAERFRHGPHVLRFIEFMDVGTLNRWEPSAVVTASEIHARLSKLSPLRPLDARRPGEVAERFAYEDGSGEVGIIASVTRPFCGDCNRGRISAEGQLLTCLFASEGLDLRGPMRAGASDAELLSLLTAAWRNRDDRYSEQRAELAQLPRRRLEMYQVGG
ncbi:MAG: GTP 3',8-cyclase MoaA [Polyangiales bacterium]